MQVIKYHFEPHGDERGQLIALEENHNIPFDIKRVYYMYDTGAGVRRGYHAHKCLRQILICVHGSYAAIDTSDAVLMVLASEWYDESDYIRDYDSFLRYVKGEGQT